MRPFLSYDLIYRDGGAVFTPFVSLHIQGSDEIAIEYAIHGIRVAG